MFNRPSLVTGSEELRATGRLSSTAGKQSNPQVGLPLTQSWTHEDALHQNDFERKQVAWPKPLRFRSVAIYLAMCSTVGGSRQQNHTAGRIVQVNATPM
jgi:hypothetical protein